ncbi:MAG: threonylcarbamoyl-AMP synthase [Bacteroidales bacterium]|nr:threonylcarbamoyl-AMP synthase [Bacteroidales bacterium]MCF8344957.1 threonylcarbamoyl-AMP synthase [Bacteroidales bacterium]MCF8350701.1 threonylcarbamoyl-AMP synthase [Bacteroidales bacterium]MCF8376994.1 threonylcarbamoyl-AMP synthase [Bacteroidales bacterium]MCF8400853.1 threonylcarbamoyl-AMP synthase [Bacteroidales bacterium]
MEEEIRKTVAALKAGKTILYPTDTVWGIGCDATSSRAVEKIYKIKKRVENKSLIILLDEASKIKKYVKQVPEIAVDLLLSINTPLTIIYPQAKNLAKNVVAKDGSIAIRIIEDEFSKKVIAEFGKPIVSTSANITGGSNPIVFSQISQEIKDAVDYVVNLHHKRISETKPSTIIKLEISGEFKVIRS